MKATLVSALLVVGALLQADAARAQGASSASISGRVLDAGTGLPIPAATVTLEPVSSGLMVDARAPLTIASVRTTITEAAGAYRFHEIVPGNYRLRIERLGYRAMSVQIDVRRPVAASVSVGLELQPIALEAVRVDQRAPALFQRATTGAAELDEARVASERARQAMFLAPDARMLTYADVLDGVTLGEGDVFRALQRFPGVSTRDDYTAELWTRNAPWTQSRVTFDGVPLFNPVHAVGILSAITPEILGAAFFHPGIHPASSSGASAALIDLRSRPGGGQGDVRGVADVSLASSKLVLDQHIARRGAWIIAARRSHLSTLTSGLGELGLDDLDLPYVFYDITGRIDLQLGERARIEVSGLAEQDRIKGDVENILERTNARWGNQAGRATLVTNIGGSEVSHTIGASRFSARTDQRLVRTRDPSPWTEPATVNEIEFGRLSGQIAPGTSTTGATWSFGYDATRQRGHYDGPLPRYYAVKPDTAAQIRYDRDLNLLGLWADVRAPVGAKFTVNPALRIETGGDLRNTPDMRLAPSVALRFSPSTNHAISIAAGRSWQYVQAIGLAGPSIHPAFHASHFWIWSDQNTPALRSDIVSVGSENWLGRHWLASITAYKRKQTGVRTPDPTPGLLQRRNLRGAIAEEDASGVEVNLRRIGALWSTSLGYTYGQSELQVDSFRFASPADRRHVVDAMLGVSLSRSLRVAGAFTSMSGAPFTRAYANTRANCQDFGFGCNQPDGSYVQAANAERTPPYHSLDASVHWAHAIAGVEVAAYLQVRNLLGRDNASTYAGSNLRTIATRRGRIVEFEDRFEEGLPRLPLFGLRVTF